MDKNAVRAARKRAKNKGRRPLTHQHGNCDCEEDTEGLPPVPKTEKGGSLPAAILKKAEKEPPISKSAEGELERRRLEKAFVLRDFASQEEWLLFVVRVSRRHLVISSSTDLSTHPHAAHITAGYCLFSSGLADEPAQIKAGWQVALSVDKNCRTPIILTTDHRGGPKAKIYGRNVQVKPGQSLLFTVTEDFPKVLYYQSPVDMDVGGPIIRTDGTEWVPETDSESESGSDSGSSSDSD